MVALPTVNSDNNVWGTELNAWALVNHNNDGTHNIASTSLTDTTFTSLATSHEIVRNSTGKWFNILHRFRPSAYGAAMDGVTDDSTAIQNMLNDCGTAGKGYVEFSNKTAVVKNIEIPSRVIFDLNGGALQAASTMTSSDDIVRTKNFTTYTGTSTVVSTGAPYGWELLNGFIYSGNISNQHRHSLAIYSEGYRLSNLHIMHSGIGSGIWQEYTAPGNAADWGTNQPNQWFSGKSTIINDVSVLDGVTTAGVTTAPVANDMILNVSACTGSPGSTLTITTARSHFLTTGATVTLASLGGLTGASGNFTVTVTSAFAFTVTGTFTGTYTSGGTVTYHVSAAWYDAGPSDQQWLNIYAYSTTKVRGRRGILWGGAAPGCDIANIHVYNNFDVAVDMKCGGVTARNAQFEGSNMCCCLLRANGRYSIEGRIYGGFGGNTELSMRDTNHNVIKALMHQAGSGNAPPSGFDNVYWESYSSGDNMIDLMIEHDFNTTCKASRGTAPGTSYVRAHLNSFGGSTVTSDWGTLASPLWHYYAAPTGTTLVTA